MVPNRCGIQLAKFTYLALDTTESNARQFFLGSLLIPHKDQPGICVNAKQDQPSSTTLAPGARYESRAPYLIDIQLSNTEINN